MQIPGTLPGVRPKSLGLCIYYPAPAWGWRTQAVYRDRVRGTGLSLSLPSVSLSPVCSGEGPWAYEDQSHPRWGLRVSETWKRESLRVCTFY